MKKKFFENWKIIEIAMLLIGVTLSITSGIICKSDLITIACASIAIVCAITQAKGKLISQILGLILVVIYSILSFNNRYYGEMIIYIGIMLPLFVAGIISWNKHLDDETDTVNTNQIKRSEWIVLIGISIVLFVALYNVLKIFNTNQLFVSTLSMVTSMFATYLVTKRSKYGFLFYIANDIILFLLWGLPVIFGAYSLVPMLVNPLVLCCSDIYAWFSWKKREKSKGISKDC